MCEKQIKDFVIKELPVGNYIVCKIEAEDFTKLVTEALDKAVKYLFSTWLQNHQIITESFSAEKYYMNYEYGSYMELWVKSLN